MTNNANGCLGSFSEPALLNNIIQKTASNGSPFLELQFIKRDGEKINGKVWSTLQKDYEHEAGKVYVVTATLEEYKGIVGLRDINLRETNESPYNYMKTAPIDINNIKNFISGIYLKINNEMYQKLIGELLVKNIDDNTFWNQPAAQVIHEAYPEGLAYHTYSMLRSAYGIMKGDLYNSINKDLLFTSIIIHDLGKLAELSGPIGTNYTKIGQLIGHISIIDSWIVKFMIENNIDEYDEDFMLLRHSVLSHHGKKEYGSPVEPKTMEARLLFQLDYMDSQMAQFEEKMDEIEEGEFSNMVYNLGVSLYKHCEDN